MQTHACCCRYERSKDRSPQGSSIVQRHVAQPADIRNHEGKGVLVRLVSSAGNFHNDTAV